MTVSTLTTARKAMLRLLELFGEPSGNNPRPCEIRNYLLEVDEFLDTCPALEIARTEATLKQARQVVKESRLLLRIAELQEQLAESRAPSITPFPKIDVLFHGLTIPPVPVRDDLPTPAGFKMSEKSASVLRMWPNSKYAAFINAGWTNATLIAHGLMERIPDGAVCSIGAGASANISDHTGAGGRMVSGGAGSVSSPHMGAGGTDPRATYGGGGSCDTSWMDNAGARGTDV